MNIKQSIGLCSLLFASVVQANVSGTVYKDIPFNGTTPNTYGQKESNEEGVEGITVTAFPSGESTTTAKDGTWSLKSTGKVRVEFTNIPSYLKEGQNQSSVQFIDGDSSSVDLALYNPAEYATSASNDIALTTQANSALVDNSAVSLKVLNSSSIPTDSDIDTAPSDTSKDVKFQKLGTTWGLAYDNAHKDFYVAAALRRHGAIGKDGLGAIYKIHDGAVETFTTIDVGSVATNEQRNLSTDPTQPSHDPIFDEVGRVGLGDIDISEDGTKLYVVNITKNSLVEINIADKSQKSYDIGNPFSSCSDVKSWGIGQKDGNVYVGSVCTTDMTQGAYISKLKDSKFEPFHHIPLDMTGENSLYTNSNSEASLVNENGKRWRVWITNPDNLFNPYKPRASLPAPILSDIVFDENKGMILGFIDRTAMQAGVRNYSPKSSDNTTYRYDSAGDIFKVCNVNGTYKNEGEAGCPLTDTTGHEFFLDDEWEKTNSGNGLHKEIALGGLSYLQGSQIIATSAFDPAKSDNNNFDSSGIIWMNSKTGKKLAAQVMVGGPNDLVYNGKAGGVGDLEILTPEAPTEIGNRVWFDENANCIQDANESGIEGVTINLYASDKCEGVPESTVKTDKNGQYLFPVNAGKTYSVCIDNMSTQSVLKEKKLTCNSKGSTINNSDAVVAGDDAVITVNPLNTGANDHSFDFGFTGNKKAVPTPVTPVPTDNNRTVDHNNGTCDCHSYKEDSAPSLNIWSMMLLLSLTSLIAFLFRKELDEAIR